MPQTATSLEEALQRVETRYEVDRGLQEKRERLSVLDSEKEQLVLDINRIESEKEEKRKEVVAYFEAKAIVQAPPEI